MSMGSSETLRLEIKKKRARSEREESKADSCVSLGG